MSRITVTIDRERNLRATLTTSVIGPAHDPYNAETITIKLPHGTEACYYVDGLGSQRFSLTQNNELLREESFHGPMCDFLPSSQLWRLKANLLCKRLTGITFDQAEEALLLAASLQYQDPMGPASRYI